MPEVERGMARNGDTVAFEPKVREAGERAGIGSIDAALPVLRAIATQSRSMTLTELATATGMPASKIHRYLVSFVRGGLVLQHPGTRRYDLGPFAADLGLSALARNDFVNRAADDLPELSLATGLTGYISVWGDHGPTVVRWYRTPSFVVAGVGLGSALPLLDSSTGRVFLSYMPRHLVAGRLELELRDAQRSGLSWPDIEPKPEGVATLVSTIRDRGFALVEGSYVPGVAMAAPILNWQDEIEAAVTLAGNLENDDSRDSALRLLLRFTASHSVRSPLSPAEVG